MKKNYKEVCASLCSLDYDQIGNIFISALQEEDNSLHELGKSILSLFSDVKSEKEFFYKNSFLIAITGYSLEELLNSLPFSQ